MAMTIPNQTLAHNIDFPKATAEDFADPVPFDHVVGQFVLLHPLHQPDLATFILLLIEALRLDAGHTA